VLTGDIGRYLGSPESACSYLARKISAIDYSKRTMSRCRSIAAPVGLLTYPQAETTDGPTRQLRSGASSMRSRRGNPDAVYERLIQTDDHSCSEADDAVPESSVTGRWMVVFKSERALC
jgi:hypothetical protein